MLDLQLSGNCWGVLACITFTEDEERLISCDAHLVEAAVACEVELLKGIVEISCHLVHVLAVGRWAVVRVSITETSADWLVDEQDVVLLDICEVVGYNLPRGHVSWLDKTRTKFHEVAKLTGRSGPSIEPDNSWDVLDLLQGGSLLAVEHEGKAGSSLVDVEIAAPDQAGVVERGGGEIDGIADSAQFDIVVVLFFGDDAVLDIDAFLLEEGGGV